MTRSNDFNSDYFTFPSSLRYQTRVPDQQGMFAWKSFRNGHLNQGISPVRLRSAGPLSESLKKRFESRPLHFQTRGLIWSTAVIDDQGFVYVGSADKVFYCFNAECELRWSYTITDKPDALIDSAAALTSTGKVIVPGGDGIIHALDRESGKLIWTFQAHHVSDEMHQKGNIVNSFEGNVQVGPNGLIYAGSDNGTLYALDDDGKEVWSFTTGMMIWSSPVFDPAERWMAFGSLDSTLYLLEPCRGHLLATFKTKADIKSSPTTDGENNIYFGCSDYNFYSVSVRMNAEGEFSLVENWRFTTYGEVYSSPAYKDGRVVFGSLDGNFYCLNTHGNLLWKYSTYSRISSSPLITLDDVVVFGAKNGKLYALDLLKGQRLWSFSTSNSHFKSNLDASPALGPNRVVYNGAYSGNVYGIPTPDLAGEELKSSYQFGGTEDLPDYGDKIGENEATLRFEDPNGILCGTLRDPVTAGAILKLKLIAFSQGKPCDRAAISASGLKVRISPEVEVETYVSSDGQYLNIFPKTFFKAGERYRIEVSGSYYQQRSWIMDRFQYFNLKEFSARLQFEVKTRLPGATKALDWNSVAWGVKSLYLQQPAAMDTYIPAAMDGQGFLVTAFGHRGDSENLLLLALPALPVEEGVKLLCEPSKAFVMRSHCSGPAVKGRGEFKLAAMGGEFYFKEFLFSGEIDEKGDLAHGEFFAIAPVLSIKGNDSNYRFPMNLANKVCDYKLRIIALGSLKGHARPILPSSELPVRVSPDKVQFTGENSVRVRLESGAKDMFLFSSVQYNPSNGEVHHFHTQSISPSEKGQIEIAVPLIKHKEADKVESVLAFFYNHSPIGQLDCREIALPKS